MMISETGRILIREKPLITEESMNLPKLRALPETSFGKGHATFMDHHGFSADERSEVRFMTDADLAYTMARYRQVHDFWHVLAGLPPTVLGEVALKCFEFRVTGLPVCALGGVLGQLKLDAAELSKLHSEYILWTIRAGSKCGDLMSYRYEDNLERPLEEVQQELNFEPVRYLFTPRKLATWALDFRNKGVAAEVQAKRVEEDRILGRSRWWGPPMLQRVPLLARRTAVGSPW